MGFGRVGANLPGVPGGEFHPAPPGWERPGSGFGCSSRETILPAQPSTPPSPSVTSVGPTIGWRRGEGGPGARGEWCERAPSRRWEGGRHPRSVGARPGRPRGGERGAGAATSVVWLHVLAISPPDSARIVIWCHCTVMGKWLRSALPVFEDCVKSFVCSPSSLCCGSVCCHATCPPAGAVKEQISWSRVG